MKIAFICQPFDTVIAPNKNSLGIFTTEVAKRLTDSSSITIFAHSQFQRKGSYLENIRYQFIPVIYDRIFLRFVKVFSFLMSRNKPYYASSLAYFGYIRTISSILQKENYDIIHILNFSQFVPIIRRKNPNSKIILHMQCEWLTQMDKKMIFKRIVKADMVLGCSDYITQKIQKRFQTLSHQCFTLYNGVDTNSFFAQRKKKKAKIRRILFVGRVSPEKGVHILLRAIKKVASIYPDIHLQVIGQRAKIPAEYVFNLTKDKEEQKLLSLYHKKSKWSWIFNPQATIPAFFQNKVKFLGPVAHEDLPSHYRESDIFIFPSVWNEPFGIPIIEAMASGIPVIATKGGGISEIISDNSNGFLIDRGNVTDLINKLLKLLKNETLRFEMGEIGRLEVEKKFTWEKIAEQLLQRYLELHQN